MTGRSLPPDRERSMPQNMLPEGFEALEPFQAYWGVPDTQTRRERREASTMAEFTAFYDVILPLAPAAMKQDRMSVVEGKSVSVRVDIGGRRVVKQHNTIRDTDKYNIVPKQ